VTGRDPMSLLALLLAGLAVASPIATAAAVPAASPAVARETIPAGLVTRLPTRERVVALTFDACEAGKRMTLDRRITDLLVARRIPFTIFMGGRFARDNEAAVRGLAAHDFISIQNHTWSHPRDLRLLDDEAVREQVERASVEIAEVVGRRPTLFRFPGGHADARTVELVRGLGYTPVQWRWAEGDPAPQIGAEQLTVQTLDRTRPGDILIFHVNGRGWHTGEALPAILDGLAARGFRFVLVSDYVGPP